nr:hypothetical protein GCM10025699_27400 [Microbacterium flavescens]
MSACLGECPTPCRGSSCQKSYASEWKGHAMSDLASVELGLDTFGDITRDDTGALRSAAQTIRDVVDEAVLADQVGLAFFGVGEHHRREFAISSPEIVLAAAAARTERIHLGTAVTVLSSDDPVRVYERFATLDAVSSGRAEVILGRGSFIESFPLFGYDLRDYETLFDEKLDLFSQLIEEKPVTWQGTLRARSPTPTCSPRPRTDCARGSASEARPNRSCGQRATDTG